MKILFSVMKKFIGIKVCHLLIGKGVDVIVFAVHTDNARYLVGKEPSDSPELVLCYDYEIPRQLLKFDVVSWNILNHRKKLNINFETEDSSFSAHFPFCGGTQHAPMEKVYTSKVWLEDTNLNKQTIFDKENLCTSYDNYLVTRNHKGYFFAFKPI